MAEGSKEDVAHLHIHLHLLQIRVYAGLRLSQKMKWLDMRRGQVMNIQMRTCVDTHILYSSITPLLHASMP